MGGIMSYSKLISPANQTHPVTDTDIDIESGGKGERVKASDELYRIARTGKATAFADNDQVSSWLSPAANNTLLHVAAQHGNEDMVKLIISVARPSLVLKKNLRGDTALHLAAKAGHEATVKALVDNNQGNLLRETNENGNTALHEALLFNSKDDDSVAKNLIERDPELLFIKNNEEESAMYLAVKAGFRSCISLAPRQTPEDQRRLDELFKNNSMAIVKEAIQKKDDTGVLEAIHDLSKECITQFREKKKNPLHYAASLGYYKMTQYLLKICGDYATKKDEDGSLPIHLASIDGHVKVVELLLKDILDPEELLDGNERNILHLAAENGRDNVVKFLLTKTNLKYHTNMKDKEGNTALHLATKNWKAMVVRILTWHKGVYIDAVNDQGYTALGVAEISKQNDCTNTKWLTINALTTAGATRTDHESVTPKKEEKETATSNKIYKEKVNYRLLVAILIATVAFEAGFSLPYQQDMNFHSRSNSSLEKTLRRKAFTVYVFSNTIAMYSSVAAAVVLSWAQSGDLNLVITALNFTLPLFWLALSMMSMAFTAGVYLVINHHTWLGMASLALGVSFHMFLLFNSFVLFSPIVSSNKYLRYLCYYPFRFLVLMNSGWLTNASRLRYFMWSTQH